MSATPFGKTAFWIWHPDFNRPHALFRREFDAPPCPVRLIAHVSADSDYILYFNGNIVARGPAAGDIKHAFYDMLDLSTLVLPGRNALCARIASFAFRPARYYMGVPVRRMSANAAFILDAALETPARDTIEALHTDSKWLCIADESVEFPLSGTLASPDEHARIPGPLQNDWARPGFDAAAWTPALEIERGVRPDNVLDSEMPHRLVPRMIPMLAETRRGFARCAWARGCAVEEAEEMLSGRRFLTIPAGASASICFDAKDMATAFPCLRLAGQGRVVLRYLERFTRGGEIVRDPRAEHDEPVAALTDRLEVDGAGEWSPFFWRAFRFVLMEIGAGHKPLSVESFDFIDTHYPYSMRGCIKADDDSIAEMWRVGARTLECCSHETFEDCPYYERLQYAGDLQIEALAAYCAAGDTALARQGLYHFAWSVNHEGLTASRYPSRIPQIIPLWSLHWILCVHDYFMYTGDRETALDMLPGIRSVLGWFHARAGADGILGKLPYWGVADWSPDWEGGVPTGMNAGASALPSFMLASAMEHAAGLLRHLRFELEARGWARRARRLLKSCRAIFFDRDRGLFTDEPGGSAASSLTNAWAILSGAAAGRDAVRVAGHLLAQGMSRPSYFGLYFVQQALLKAGEIDSAYAVLDSWRELLKQGCVTWPECLDFPRSDCHAWCCGPNVFFSRTTLGVGPAEPGCGAVSIAPKPGPLLRAEGVVPLPQGDARIAWERAGGGFRLSCELPAGVVARVRLPGGFEAEAQAGAFEFADR